jgi:hypothetical protein
MMKSSMMQSTPRGIIVKMQGSPDMHQCRLCVPLKTNNYKQMK